jgi:hypothetical protein
METTWEKIRKNIGSTFRSLSEKTGEITRIGRLKLEIVAVKRDIEKAFIEVGGRVFQSFEKKQTGSILSETEILDLIEGIRKKQSRLQDLEKEIEQIRDQSLKKDTD